MILQKEKHLKKSRKMDTDVKDSVVKTNINTPIIVKIKKKNVNFENKIYEDEQY